MRKKKQLLLCCAVVFIFLTMVSVFASADCYGAYCEVPYFSQVSFGSTGNTVKVVQSFLRNYKTGWAATIDLAGGVDGDFGNTTKQLVQSFQVEQGLISNPSQNPNGTVTSATWSAIRDHTLEDTMVYPSESDLTHQARIRTNQSCYLAYEIVWFYRHLAAENQINFYHKGGVLSTNFFHYCAASSSDFDSGLG